ncbi:MAG: hypothetical protein M3Z26_08425 [Bacteroidota bacterium]|nr:hypothetical protein [Bacteroidota bacterium]
MKKILLFSFLSFITLFANAQAIDAIPKDYLKLMKKYKINDQKFPKDSLLFAQMLTLNPKAKFLYKTDKGSVYALPLDRMSCLVPDFHLKRQDYKRYHQEITQGERPVPIPNPMPKTEVIPIPDK